jgi:TM2 domain-containing membrane protein YozV|tara:strand:- start:4 stop:717 length:714 start_codon:yes stop_codon:yes gene_type:complete
MNIFNDVIRGASTQFGREFGRAGANAILKGKNYYSVNSSSDYSGRIKPSDSIIITAIKEINKIKFVTTDKANTSRLIELTDLASDQIIFKGVDTLNQISDIKQLINDYNDKFEHGSILVSDDFKDKSLDFLKEKRQEFINLLEKFNTDSKAHIKKNLELELRKKKSKKIAALLAIPCLGFQWAYLKSPGIAVLSVLLCWTIIVPVINFIFLLKVLFMSQDKFDMEFNPVFSYYNQFK